MYIQKSYLRDNTVKTKNIDSTDDIDHTVKQLSSFEHCAYLCVLFHIWWDASKNLMNYRMQGLDTFWLGNKLLLNYFNSMYAIKEYLEENYPELCEKKAGIVDKAYYNAESWFFFACEYRNRLIHQANVIKDYSENHRELVLCLDEFVELQKKQLQRSNASSKKLKEAFIIRLESMYQESNKYMGKHYIRLLYVIQSIDRELLELLNHVFFYVFKNNIQGILDGLLYSMCNENGEFCLTEYYSANNDVVLLPNTELENLYVTTILNTSPDSGLSILLYNYLQEKGYTYLFSQRKTLKIFNDLYKQLTIQDENATVNM